MMSSSQSFAPLLVASGNVSMSNRERSDAAVCQAVEYARKRKGAYQTSQGEVETKAKLLEDAKSKLEDFEEYFYNPVLTEQVRLKREVVDAKDELIKAEDCGANIKEAGFLNRGMFWGKIKAKNLEAFRAAKCFSKTATLDRCAAEEGARWSRSASSKAGCSAGSLRG